MYICESCGKEVYIKFGSSRFCSQSCANKRKLSEETKRKIKEKLTKNSKECAKCGLKLSHNNVSGFCKTCRPPSKKRSELVSEWRRRRKLKLINIKGDKCEICGYNKCIWALEFHHLDPKEKDFSISQKNIKSMEKYIEEIKKCILVCSNCHREIHTGMVSLENYVVV